MTRWLLHILQGIGIGAANVIPGVSGGTMALIFGIYERIISIANEAVHAGIAVLRLDRAAFTRRLLAMQWSFVIPLLSGIVIITLTGARYLPQMLETWPEHSRSLFFGLMAGSIAIPWLRTSSNGAKEVGLAIAAAVVAFLLAGLPVGEMPDPTLLQVFFAAAVAVSAMILPGVSGAFLLLVLGMYTPVLRAVDNLDMIVIAVFVAGAAGGLGAFSLFLGWVLRRYHDQTMAVLVGLMAGSLRALWPWLDAQRGLQMPGPGQPVADILLVMAFGIIVSGAVTIWEIRKRRKGQDTPE